MAKAKGSRPGWLLYEVELLGQDTTSSGFKMDCEAPPEIKSKPV